MVKKKVEKVEKVKKSEKKRKKDKSVLHSSSWSKKQNQKHEKINIVAPL